MRERLKLFLFTANLVLLASLLSLGSPRPAAAQEGEGLVDCCLSSVEGQPHCCDNCCWFLSDCDNNQDCGA